MGLCYNLSDQVFYDTKILNGYYYGNDKMFTSVFVKISGDTAFVDFIFFQKYPRELLSDTLFYQDNHIFTGRIVNILPESNKYYICTNQESKVFGNKVKIKIKSNELYYQKHIDEFKNYAVWHECYSEFMRKNDYKNEADKYFRELSKKNNIKLKIDT